MMRRLLIAFLVLIPATAVADKPMEPGPHEPEVAGLIKTFLGFYHYNPQKLDDDLSACWYDGYIEGLDPNRMVFLASDLEEFAPYRTTLDDAMNGPQVDLAPTYAIYDRWLQRMAERTPAQHKAIDQDYTFTSKKRWAFDRDEAPWPKTAKEADALWSQRIQSDLLAGLLDERPVEETRGALHKRVDRRLGDIEQFESLDVLELAMGALARCFDPHSTWFKPQSRDDFDISMSRSLEGIGAVLGVDGEYTKVQELVAGGPAARGGQLQKGDRIIAVAQGMKPPVDIIAMRLEQVVSLIRGEKGTRVRLKVLPVDGAPGETRMIPILRDKVTIEENSAELTMKEVDGANIALIDVPSFYVDARAVYEGRPDAKRVSGDVKAILDGLDPAKVDAVVLDMRTNGGGSLSESVDLMGLFIESGPVVRVRAGSGEIEDEIDLDTSVSWSGALAVLTSPVSASASEIFAAAVQDYGRGIVVGSETTHGKGTVQQLFDLQAVLEKSTGGRVRERVGGSLKFTSHKFYRVNGGSTQLRGVRSDVIVPSIFDGVEREGDLPGALVWDEIPPTKVKDFGVDVDLADLQARSDARVADDARMQELLAALKRTEELRATKSISLNLEERKKELEEAKARRSEDDDTDPTLDEALRVIKDYTDALK